MPMLGPIAASQSLPTTNVSDGLTPAMCNRLFDLKSLSELPRTPAMPSVDHANGALCHKRTHAPQQIRRAYSITLSARVMIEGGMEIPSALAVEKLMTSSYFVNISTGRSAGFVPLRIWSTKYATRRHLSLVLTP